MGIDDYNKEFIKSLSYSRRHFWFLHRNEIIYHAIRKFCRKKKRILELGAGSGNILSYLSAKNLQVDGADIYVEALPYISQYADRVFQYDVKADPESCKVKDIKESYEVVILGDLIEHLEDPIAALINARYFCKDKGIVIITVPALMWLWSPYDNICGHKRRYNTDMLKKEMEEAGLECVFIKYFFFIVSNVLFVRRRITKSTPNKLGVSRNNEIIKGELRINAFFNLLFKLICKFELFICKFINLPFGSSIIAVGSIKEL